MLKHFLTLLKKKSGKPDFVDVVMYHSRYVVLILSDFKERITIRYGSVQFMTSFQRN